MTDDEFLRIVAHARRNLTPEQIVRLRAVGPDSPLRERAGAMLLGFYIPMTGDEGRALLAEVEAAATVMDAVGGLLAPEGGTE